MAMMDRRHDSNNNEEKIFSFKQAGRRPPRRRVRRVLLRMTNGRDAVGLAENMLKKSLSSMRLSKTECCSDV
jgi:hypothetical protein